MGRRNTKGDGSITSVLRSDILLTRALTIEDYRQWGYRIMGQ